MAMTPTNSDDIVYVRDVIARVEELEGQAIEADEEEGTEASDGLDEDEREELKQLRALLTELAGYGGDHQWEGSWYPGSLVADDYFERYAQQFAEDIGAIKDYAGWPGNCIDWEQAAEELQLDYSSVKWAGVTYWYR